MKKSITSILFAIAALAATTAVANVTTNVFTNMTYRSRISYSLVPVTNSVMKPVLERNGSLTMRAGDYKCYSTGIEYIDFKGVEENDIVFALGGKHVNTNVNGFACIYAEDLAWTTYQGTNTEWTGASNHMFTSTVEQASFELTPYITYHCEFDAFNLYLDSNAAQIATVWGTNGLHTVTNVAKTIVYKPDFEVKQMLFPSITQAVVTNVYTNIFVNGINVTR